MLNSIDASGSGLIVFKAQWT